jgi:hypothetical protein
MYYCMGSVRVACILFHHLLSSFSSLSSMLSKFRLIVGIVIIGEATLTVVVADAPTTILEIITNYQIYTTNAPPGTKYLCPLPAQTWYEVLKACFEAQQKKAHNWQRLLLASLLPCNCRKLPRSFLNRCCCLPRYLPCRKLPCSFLHNCCCCHFESGRQPYSGHRFSKKNTLVAGDLRRCSLHCCRLLTAISLFPL